MGASTSAHTDPTTIVVGFDFSELAGSALGEAIGIATRLGLREFQLVTVVAPAGGERVLLPGDEESVREDIAPEIVRERVGELVRDYQSRGGAVGMDGIGIYVVTGLLAKETARAIVDIARAVHAELVVVGARGHTEDVGFPIGAVAEYIVKEAPCSVHVVRSPSLPRAKEAPKNGPPVSSEPHYFRHLVHRHIHYYVDRVGRSTHRATPSS